jgi:hypothetical protein
MFKVELRTEIENEGTAIKAIDLPFVPFVGLQIKEKDLLESCILDEYEVEWVVWDVPTQSFQCEVMFGIAGDRIAVEIESLEPRGWTRA